MKNNNIIMNILQTFLTQDEVKSLCELLGYTDVARKFTVYDLLQYFVAAAFGEWKGFRYGVDNASNFNLSPVNYSTFSKKASDVPFAIFKKLFHMLLEKCNRPTRRALNLKKDLLAVDSTTITVGEKRLPWALFHGKRSGIKLHVQFNVNSLMPSQVEESIARKHDGPMGEKLINPECILVEDRAYTKIDRFDSFVKNEHQSFVIRIKENITIANKKALQRTAVAGSNVIEDITCKLGAGKKCSENRFRVVIFKDDYDNEIRVCTDILNLSAETIAAIYKA